MSYEIIGKLVSKMPVIQRSETFKTREFVIEKSEEVNGRTLLNYVKFQCVQDKTQLPDKYNIGDEVKVYFNIRGTKWMKDGKENFITNLDAWRLEAVKLGGTEAQGFVNESFNGIPPQIDGADDLPF
ncbi:MAG: DUF3127 domain-containing protein [Chitinophagaceae bacterium]